MLFGLTLLLYYKKKLFIDLDSRPVSTVDVHHVLFGVDGQGWGFIFLQGAGVGERGGGLQTQNSYSRPVCTSAVRCVILVIFFLQTAIVVADFYIRPVLSH